MYLGLPGLGIGRTRGRGSAFSPLDLPDLLLWLRADLGVVLNGAAVETWQDQSGNGHHVTQVTPADRPVVSAAAIGGKPAIDFSGSKFLENALTNMVAANTARSALCVAKNINGCLISIRRSTAHSCSLFFEAAGTMYIHGDGVNMTSNVTIADASAETRSATNAFYSCHRFVGGANNPSLFLNGTSRPITSVGTQQATEDGSTGFLIGKNASDQFCNGLIAEVIYTSSAISPADRALVEAYQDSFWGGLP